jgi:hypothetical protein
MSSKSKQTTPPATNLVTKGYKVTDSKMRCRSFQYEIGKLFNHDGTLTICGSGFHFCQVANDCFNYYSFESTNRVFEIEAYGEIITDGDKSCCAQIKFIRELTWQEILNTVNTGKDNTGRANTGDRNTGDWNTGDRNTGDWNTGDWNTGNRNTGDRNTGNRNTGDRNTGYSNTGDWNTGDWNTGYSNTGDRNTGVFCTGVEKIMLFDKPSDWTIDDFKNSAAFSLMYSKVDTKIWVDESVMTDEEKEKYPSFKTAGGYLKDIPFKESFANAWHNWTAANKKAFTTLPNFDAAIFETITSVKVK